MSKALTIMAESAGVSTEEITEVVKGMIISSKNQHGSKATNAEIAVVSSICAKYDLNPLVSECAAFVSGGKLQMVVMISGWYKMVNRQESFDGVEFDDKFDDKGKIFSTTCRMYLKNRSRPVSVTEYMDECFDHKSSVWKRWPARMIRHKAYIQAARMAFGISEVIDDDEQNRIIDNSPKVSKPVQAVDFEEMDRSMAECGDLDSLQELCVTIRTELEKGNAWESSKAKCAAMKIQHKNRIESMVDDIEDAEFEDVAEVYGEYQEEGEEQSEEQDISFE